MLTPEELCAEAAKRMPPSQIDNHYSDLYLLKTPISTALIEQYEFKRNVQTFKSAIDGQQWYDIPFAYTPFCVKAAKKNTPKK